jgi:7-carboxy-7-deazaguanine synthase
MYRQASGEKRMANGEDRLSFMQIIEIYKSLQGESSYAGLPCIFVRLAGCNLRCSWCDSEYTFKGGSRLTLEEIEAEVRRLSPKGGLVEITGGEPLLQEREAVPLMDRLLSAGYCVLLETSGERPLERVPREVVKIVDVKCPDSGEGGRFRMENLIHLTSRDEIKFVISSRGDYEFARDFTREHALEAKASVIFSPAFRKTAAGTRDVANCLLDPQDLAQWMLADDVNARLGLQIHKFIWEPQVKGV